ncbi:hypothetical protein, partial [Roseiarcus fermentans]|uniref:hypothetical protein n=1 Tax=Roseiarcus fermentans TaxID=1473586 RepID=UPI001AECDB42
EDAEQPRTQLGHAEQTRVLEFDHRRPTGFAPTPAQSSEAILPPNKERRRDRVSDLLTKDIRAIHAAACLLRKKLLRLLLATKGGGTTRGRDSGPAALDRFASLAMTALLATGLGVTFFRPGADSPFIENKKNVLGRVAVNWIYSAIAVNRY